MLVGKNTAAYISAIQCNFQVYLVSSKVLFLAQSKTAKQSVLKVLYSMTGVLIPQPVDDYGIEESREKS